MDFLLTHHGSISVLIAMTAEAQKWIDEHIQDEDLGVERNRIVV